MQLRRWHANFTSQATLIRVEHMFYGITQRKADIRHLSPHFWDTLPNPR